MTNNDFIVFYDKDEYGDYLMHYGVLGMKWGVIRDRVKSGAKLVGKGVKKAASGTRKQVSALAKKIKAKRAVDQAKKADKKAEKIKKKTSSKNLDTSDKPKSLKDMSDSDLDAAIKRMEKEKRYTDLNSQLHPKNEKKSFGGKMLDAIKDGAVQGTKTLISNQIPNIGKEIVKELTKDEDKERMGKLGQQIKTIEMEEWLKEYRTTKKRPDWKPSAK